MSKDVDEAVFSVQLKRALQEIGMTQLELAGLSGLTPASISMFISGTREPLVSTLLKICDALDLTPNDLLAFTSEKQMQMKTEVRRLKQVLTRAIEVLENEKSQHENTR